MAINATSRPLSTPQSLDTEQTKKQHRTYQYKSGCHNPPRSVHQRFHNWLAQMYTHPAETHDIGAHLSSDETQTAHSHPGSLAPNGVTPQQHQGNVWQFVALQHAPRCHAPVQGQVRAQTFVVDAAQPKKASKRVLAQAASATAAASRREAHVVGAQKSLNTLSVSVISSADMVGSTGSLLCASASSVCSQTQHTAHSANTAQHSMAQTQKCM